MTPFHAHQGIIYAGTARITDADAAAVGEVFRAELHAAVSAGDDLAVRNAQDLLHSLSRAEHEARTYRNERVRRLRLEAFNREHGRAA